jgi:hypothetical protein
MAYNGDMFEQVSVRVVSAMLLWSTGCVLIAVAYYSRTYALEPGMTERWRLYHMLDCIVFGAFFGALFAPVLSVKKHPARRHAIAALGTMLGLSVGIFAPPTRFIFENDRLGNGFALIWIGAFVFGVLGLVFPLFGGRSPSSIPPDSPLLGDPHPPDRSERPPDSG